MKHELLRKFYPEPKGKVIPLFSDVGSPEALQQTKKAEPMKVVDFGLRLATVGAIIFMIAESCKQSEVVPTPLQDLETVIYSTQKNQQHYDHDMQALATQVSRIQDRLPTPTPIVVQQVPTRDSKPYGH